MKARYCILPALAIAALLPVSAPAITPSWSYEHPRIASGEFPIRSACMMPAQGRLSKQGVKGAEGMAKQSDEWSTSLQNLVEAHLKTAGIELTPAMSAGSSSASDTELQQVILEIQKKYEEISGKLNRKPKDIAKSRYTLGDQVGLLPCAAKADVLVFVEGEGEILTGGKKAMGWMIGGSAASEATLILTMADAKTGEIIAFARMSNAETAGQKFVDDTEKIYGKALDKQFTKLKIGLHSEKK
jgi:hypothetical protein